MSDTPCICHEAPDAKALAHDLSDFVAAHLRAGLDQRHEALLVVSGGSTPLPFFEALSQVDLDWSRVTVTLADERWVAPDHADSNERLVRAHLLQGPASRARFVPLKSGQATVLNGLDEVEARLEALPWPADVVVLGMGADAHTASLFPHAPELGVALDEDRRQRCLAVAAPPLPNVPVDRISLSKAALLDARHLVVHVTGQAKRALLQQAKLDGPQESMPIRLAWQQSHVPCHVFISN